MHPDGVGPANCGEVSPRGDLGFEYRFRIGYRYHFVPISLVSKTAITYSVARGHPGSGSVQHASRFAVSESQASPGAASAGSGNHGPPVCADAGLPTRRSTAATAAQVRGEGWAGRVKEVTEDKETGTDAGWGRMGWGEWLRHRKQRRSVADRARGRFFRGRGEGGGRKAPKPRFNCPAGVANLLAACLQPGPPPRSTRPTRTAGEADDGKTSSPHAEETKGPLRIYLNLCLQLSVLIT